MFLIAVGLLLILHVTVIIRLYFMEPDRIDLQILWDGINRMRFGGMLYRPDVYNEHTKPPLTTFMLLPLSHLRWDDLRHVWDFLNLWLPLALGFFFLRRFELRFRAKAWVLAFALMMVISAWFWEAQLGQYNLIVLAALLLASHFERKSPRSLTASTGLGGVLAFAILMKPTNLIYLPWCIYGRERRGIWTKLLALAALPLLLALGYIAHFGWNRLISDHLLWWHSLTVTTSRHIGRSDNMGLAYLGGGSLTWLLIGLGLSTLLVVRWGKKSPFWVLGAIGWLSIATSSMGWFQNFVLLLPLYVLLCAQTLDEKNRKQAYAAVALVVAGAIIQPQLIGRPAFAELGRLKLWLLLPLLGFWVCRPRRIEQKLAILPQFPL